ncbi:DUF5333 family protein [Roseovarius marisflavi]
MQFIPGADAAVSSTAIALQPICDAKIRTYVRGRDAKACLSVRGEKYEKSKGLNPSDPAALCTLGHSESARSSRIGGLLKAK